MLVLLITSMLAVAIKIQSASADNVDWWPMFHHNLSHSGYSTSTGPATNQTLWTFTPPYGILQYACPAVFGGVVYVGSANYGSLYALNASNNETIWESKPFTDAPITDCPAVASGVVYAGAMNGYLYAFNSATGDVIWSYNLCPQGGNADIRSSPTVVNGIVYIGSKDNYVFALNAATGALVWEYFVGDAVYASPAVVNGIVYFEDLWGYVYALNASTGALIWSYKNMGASGPIASSPAVANGVVYVGGNSYGNTPTGLYAFNASTGNVLWVFQTEYTNHAWSSPSVAYGTVYEGFYDGKVCAVNATTGTLIWSYQTGGDVESSPAVAGDAVYVGSDDGNMYALNALTGESIWNYTGAGGSSSPAIANGVVYAQNNGNVYAFATLATSSTAVRCSPNPVTLGSSVTCTATVSGSNPTGTVTWSTSSSTGTFSGSNPSTLSSGSCTITYTDTSAGSVTITASYSGDSNNAPSSDKATLSVGIWTTSWDPSRDSYSFANYGFEHVAPDGWCYGMSSTAVLYFEQYFQTPLANPSAPYFPSQPPYAQNTHALQDTATTKELNNATLAILAHEIYDSQSRTNADSILHADKTNEFQQLLSSLASGQPVVLALAYLFNNKPAPTHAVVAWAAKQLSDGTYSISIYDPSLYMASGTTYATYNPTDQIFAYQAFTSFYVIVSQPIQSSWFDNIQWLWAPSYLTWWSDGSVPNYYVILADKSVTLESSSLKDYFTAKGDSRTFVCGMSGTSGIEEGDMQLYAIPNNLPWSVQDPTSSNSMLLITCVENESGQPVGYGYLLNATTTQGLLNYTATPSGSGLSISAGDNALNATVTCFSATQQGYSVSDVLTAQIDAGQNVNLTAPCLASFTASKTVVGKGYSVPMNVTINNAGTNPENVTLTLSANATTLNSTNVFNLLNGTSVNLLCGGNTSSCPYGNYTLSAYCEPNGINEAANNFTYTGTVTVTIPGDLNGDFHVSLADLVILANAYGSHPGDAKWNPNADIDGNGIVGLSDLVIMANHYGQHYP